MLIKIVLKALSRPPQNKTTAKNKKKIIFQFSNMLYFIPL
jgi:hypothetical protein